MTHALRYRIKRLLHPVRMAGRRFLMLPTIEEQQYVSFRGCIYTAATFTTRNAVAGDYLEFGVWRGDSFAKAYHAIHEMRRQHLAWLTRHVTMGSAGEQSASSFEQWRRWQPRFFAFDSFAGLPSSANRRRRNGRQARTHAPRISFEET